MLLELSVKFMRLNVAKKREKKKKLTASQSSVFERLSNLSKTSPYLGRSAVSAADPSTGTERAYGWFGLPISSGGRSIIAPVRSVGLRGIFSYKVATSLSFKSVMTEGGRNLYNDVRNTRANVMNCCPVAAKTLGRSVSNDL